MDERDSGTAYRSVNARITGSVAIPNSAVKPVTDKAVLDRLVPEVRGKVREIDLRALVISDFGEIGPRGYRRPYVPAPLELFVDDESLTLAQWPNPGQPGVPVGKVLDKGPVTRNGAKPTRGGTFEFVTDRPARWTKADDVWITGLFQNGYADNTVKVKAFDLEKRTLTTVQPHMYGFGSGKPWNRWVALNLLEEIDLPGEFMADKKTGKLFFLPPAGNEIAKRRLEVSVMKEPLVAIEGATGVVFDGVNIECSRGMGVYLERGTSNRIQNATLRNLGMVAVCVGKGVSPDPDYRHAFTGTPVSRELGSWHEHIYENSTFNRDAGTGHGIVNCQIYNIGAGAISLGGGDRKTLVPASNFVENCDLHHFNRWDRTYKTGVNIDGVGNRIRHCNIHDCAGGAIYLHGNDHVIELNEIHHAMLQGEEMGAFYMGRDSSEYGNVLRHNFFHHVGNPDARKQGCFGIHLDDGSCGLLVEGNIFYNCSHETGLNGGKNHRIVNNIFVDNANPEPRHAGIRAGWNPAQYYNWARTELIEKRLRQDLDITRPPYSERYPDLKELYEAPPTAPRFNIVERNVFVRSGSARSPRPTENPAGNQLKDNFETKTDPGFVNAAAMDFRLRSDSVVFEKIPAFQLIPLENIGLNKSVSTP